MANWVSQTPPTSQNLNHVYGFGPLSVFAVGNLGTILFWNGQTWALRTSPTTNRLNRLWGASSSSIWIVGAGGVLLNSTDGGVTWFQINTLNTAVGFGGNYAAIWGSSATDFWVIENTNGGFWRTQDGGQTWALVTTMAFSWSHMWGASANYIIASRNGASRGSFAYWNGVAWTTTGEAVAGNFDGTGCWPYAATPQNFTCGQRGLAGGIVDWAQDFSSSAVDAVPAPAAGFQYVYGADLTNLYAVGSDLSANCLIAQIKQPPGTPSTPSTWQAVALPSGLPTGQSGFNAVYADGSGYAVAVGGGGAIAARPGTALAIVSAIAVATNTVKVTLSTPPLAQSSIGAGDALNPATWFVSRLDTNGGFDVMSVRQVSPTVFNVIIYARLASALIQHSISAPMLLDPFGNFISGASSANFQGVVSDGQATQNALAASNRYQIADISNPPAPLFGTNLGGGVRIITPAGDFASQSGPDLLTKLVIRRLTTPPGGFFHLPTYGVGLRVKEPLRSSDLVALKKIVEDQVRQEPEIAAVSARLGLDANGLLTVQISGVTVTGQPFNARLHSQANSLVQGSSG